uniref:large ribosomal subunit protein bL34m n=1 Tax=Myxine glutinosa TaxID=7769 RepID=UPI00358F3E36
MSASLLSFFRSTTSILSPAFGSRAWLTVSLRGRTRGNEYQPKHIKRKHTHGWMKRISSRNGIETILRRMLKGRKSLSH